MTNYWKNFIISIKVKKLPKNCTECPFYKNNVIYDDFGDYNLCPFGCTSWGAALERVKGCPLEGEE